MRQDSPYTRTDIRKSLRPLRSFHLTKNIPGETNRQVGRGQSPEWQGQSKQPRFTLPPHRPKLPQPGCLQDCLLYTSPSPRDRTRSRMPSSA